MSRQIEKLKEEEELLAKSCNVEPKDLNFIRDSLTLQKTKTLMIRKRGLQADLERRLDQYIDQLKMN